MQHRNSFGQLLAATLLASSLLVTLPAAGQGASGYLSSPSFLIPNYLNNERYADIDALVEKLAASGQRSSEGNSGLEGAMDALGEKFSRASEAQDEMYRQNMADWLTQVPNSTVQPVVYAMFEHALAWRARGRGFAPSVTPEGWQLFRDRSERAWRRLQAAKGRSSRLPIWYEVAIRTGVDAQRSEEELDALFNEGVQRFPGYHPLYLARLRMLAPRWGGSWQAADEFIRKQIAAKTKSEGDILYVRMYWALDRIEQQGREFFEESLVNWSRMRAGFEVLTTQYRGNAQIMVNYAIYACRAGDAATYWKLHDKVKPDFFRAEAPEGYSMEICDLRLFTRV